MAAIASSSTAMVVLDRYMAPLLVSSPDRYGGIASSSTAMTAIANNKTAITAVEASAVRKTRFIIVRSRLGGYL